MNNNGASFLYATLTPIESNPVCIELRKQTDSCMTASSISSICGNIVNNVQTYIFNGAVNNYNNSTGTLTITPIGGGIVNMNPTTVPANTLNQNFTFNFTPSADAGTYCFLVTLSSATFKCLDTICFKTPNCPPPLCCDAVSLETKPQECCSKLNFGKCEVKSVQINLNGGTFDNIDIANCPDPASGTYSGLSAYTITGCFSPQSITTCVKANQGVTSVVITYVVTFVNGETCKREDKVFCAPPIGGDCCPVTTVTPCCISPNEVKYNFVASPLYSPIIGMIVTASPSANLTTSNVYDNGSSYLQWLHFPLGATTVFTTVATNSVEFAITAPLSNPVSNITVRYLLANGDTCETELFTIGGYSSKLAPVVLISEGVKKDLFASTLKLDVSKVSDKTAKKKLSSSQY